MEIIRPSINRFKRLLFYSENLVKLLDQSSYWFGLRVRLKLEKKDDQAKRIEEVYLKPLDRKIKSFAERMSLEL